jgi:hypothetical protein
MPLCPALKKPNGKTSNTIEAKNETNCEAKKFYTGDIL